MKKRNIKCTVCDSEVNYNEDLGNFTCFACNATYERDIFHFSQKRKLSFRFKNLKEDDIKFLDSFPIMRELERSI